MISDDMMMQDGNTAKTVAALGNSFTMNTELNSNVSHLKITQHLSTLNFFILEKFTSVIAETDEVVFFIVIQLSELYSKMPYLSNNKRKHKDMHCHDDNFVVIDNTGGCR